MPGRDLRMLTACPDPPLLFLRKNIILEEGTANFRTKRNTGSVYITPSGVLKLRHFYITIITIL